MMIEPGTSYLFQGPAGAGKSTLLRDAVRQHGSGFLILAPGYDEYVSYKPLVTNNDVNVEIIGLDDAEFDPDSGATTTTTRYYSLVKQAISDRIWERYKVLGVDTLTSILDFVYVDTMRLTNMKEIPKAKSPEGALFYSTLFRSSMKVMQPLRFLKGKGMHLICNAHVKTVESTDQSAIAEMATQNNFMPMVSGGFRDRLPSFFDICCHVGVERNGEHKIYWKTSLKRPARSRVGDLTEDGEPLPADWQTLERAAEAALAKL